MFKRISMNQYFLIRYTQKKNLRICVIVRNKTAIEFIKTVDRFHKILKCKISATHIYIDA